MNILKRIELAIRWRFAYHQSLDELRSYSERGLKSDLRMMPSDLPGVAAEEADLRLARFVRSRPDYRQAWDRAATHLIHS